MRQGPIFLTPPPLPHPSFLLTYLGRAFCNRMPHLVQPHAAAFLVGQLGVGCAHPRIDPVSKSTET